MSTGVSPSGPQEPGKVSEEHGGPSDSGLAGAMDAKVSTLGQLKDTLIKYLGEKKGMEMYNRFIESFALGMLAQIRQAAQSAQKAAAQARKDNQ